MFEIKSKCVITETLKKRFCKDMNLNIKIYEEPYFSNLLELYDKQFDIVEKYRQFVELVNFYGGEGEYFAAYDELKDKAITYLNENESMLYFSRKEDMNKFKCVNEGYKSTDIFVQTNDGKTFLSIDMRKGNFTSLCHYDSKIVGDCETYEDFLGMFTDKDYFKSSKYIRQVIFGNVNPRRQVTYEKYLMDIVMTDLLKFVRPEDIAFFATDEIVVELTDYYKDEDGTLNLDFVDKVEDLVARMKKDKINIRAEFFTLHKIENTSGYLKKFLYGEEKYDFKCLDYLVMPFVLRAINGEEVKPEDSVFIYEGRKCQLLDLPEIKINL